MGTRTISLTDEAYERLKASKREGESFSDVVNRIAPGVRLAEYHGALSEETADSLREAIREGRAEREEARGRRRARIASALDPDDPPPDGS